METKVSYTIGSLVLVLIATLMSYMHSYTTKEKEDPDSQEVKQQYEDDKKLKFR